MKLSISANYEVMLNLSSSELLQLDADIERIKSNVAVGSTLLELFGLIDQNIVLLKEYKYLP